MHRDGVIFMFCLALLSGMPQRGQAASGSWTINCGLWRTDAGFTSTIQLQNRLVTGPIMVTPILFMGDGSEHDLASVNIPASGVATVNVNGALRGISATAAAGFASHLSEYGSAALRFTGSSTALMAQTAIGSTALSLSYVARFTSIMNGPPIPQTLEGLWWARDAGVGGSVSVSNASGGVRNVSVQGVAASGDAQPAQSLTLAPHASQMLDLATLMGRSLKAGEAGGLRIEFAGLMGEVNVTGGLENRQEGYSAAMPFWMPPVASSGLLVTLAHAGLMVGAADPLMGFPAGTRFSPYFAMRNLTTQAIPVSLTLYTEQGQALQGPVQSLQALESRQVDMVSVLRGLGLANFSGMLTLAVSHTGQATDVMVAAGSVDAKGTYVFEVEGRTAEETLSKEAPYWSVRDGNNTMAALWNPSGNAEDVIVTLNYSGKAGNSGHYNFRVHIAPHATASLDVKELIANQSPDSEGNVVPATAQEGSFVFRGAGAVHSKLSLNANVGIFNVVKGTCYYGTVWCAGYTGLAIGPASIASSVGGSQQINALGVYDDGTEPGVNSYTSWSSSDSSVASITPGGQVTGVAAGSATITASASLPKYGPYSGYNPSCATLEQNQTFPAQAQVQVSCPTVTNFTETFRNAGPDGTLFFNYTWMSSTGKQADLASCTTGETVFYPGNASPYQWPAPMVSSSVSPTLISGSATNQGFLDRNFAPTSYSSLYLAASFNATQRFWWKCTCYQNGDLQFPFAADKTISRKVFQDTDGKWKYQITKSGQTATALLP
jgi:hypothetical protein